MTTKRHFRLSRRLLPALSAVATALCLLVGGNPARAQDEPAATPPAAAQEEKPGEKKEPWKPGLGLAGALVPVLQNGVALGEKGFGWNERLCILGGAVRNGKYNSFAFKMEAGKVYAFIGAGGEGTKNINVSVSDKAKQVLVKDDNEAPIAGVVFECKETGVYSVRVEMAEGVPDGYCALGFLIKDGGTKIEKDDILTSLNASLNAWTAIDEAMKGKGAFNTTPNQWTLYGTVLAQDKDLEITGVRPGAGPCVLVATGSGSIADISLTIKDATGKKELAKDDRVSPAAIVSVDAQATDSFRLSVRNAKSNAPSLIFATVLRVAP
jgi:hypothetical protein